MINYGRSALHLWDPGVLVHRSVFAVGRLQNSNGIDTKNLKEKNSHKFG